MFIYTSLSRSLTSKYYFIGFLSADSNLLGKSQYFIEHPQNQTVNEGETILLKCQVGNLQGTVQWTRAGFAMGKIISAALCNLHLSK